MDLRDKNVIVLGGAGFIGSHIIEELIDNEVGSLTVFDNFERGSEQNLLKAKNKFDLKIVNGDISNIDALNREIKGNDVVFHLAALWLLQCYEYPRQAFDINIAGTFNVLEACVNNNVSKLVYSSSASVYGDAEFTPMTENHPMNNKTFYGATKIAGEHMCRAFNDRYGFSQSPSTPNRIKSFLCLST